MPKKITKREYAKCVGKQLAEKSWLLSTAESCTGGGIAKAITSINGSSHWFDRAFITYSNESKMDMLGVEESTLIKHGAVSEQVVKEMAEGALANSRGHISVAVSGIAGPTGGTKAKPVGTVWVAWATEEETIAQHFLFEGTRKDVRKKTIIKSLKKLIELTAS